MPVYELIARVDAAKDDEGESVLVRSPAVGVADGVPPTGEYLNPLEGVLTLTVLGRRYVVRLPRQVQGRVTERFIEDTYTPVGYDQPLFRLSRAAAAEAAGDGAGSDAAGGRAGRGAAANAGAGVALAGAAGVSAAAADADADADLIAVTAPSEGVFYRRPSPDSPAYVEEGSAVTTGTVLGLVEVMKSFNQITYGAPGLPERGTVARVLVDDAAEVAFGQLLFLIRPAV